MGVKRKPPCRDAYGRFCPKGKVRERSKQPPKKRKGKRPAVWPRMDADGLLDRLRALCAAATRIQDRGPGDQRELHVISPGLRIGDEKVFRWHHFDVLFVDAISYDDATALILEAYEIFRPWFSDWTSILVRQGTTYKNESSGAWEINDGGWRSASDTVEYREAFDQVPQEIRKWVEKGAGYDVALGIGFRFRYKQNQ